MNMGVVPPSPGKAAATPPDRIAEKCIAFLQEVLGNFHPRDFSFRLWDGSVWDAEPGEPRLREYFQAAFRLLRPGGTFLNHGIASNSGIPPIPGPSFSDYYIFPDGELLPLGTTLLAAEGSGFEVRDVECLREHYVLTLRKWLERLESRREEACGATGDRTCRLWRLYLAGAAHKFRTGRNNVHQTLLSKPFHGDSGLPLTRGDWYV